MTTAEKLEMSLRAKIPVALFQNDTVPHDWDEHEFDHDEITSETHGLSGNKIEAAKKQEATKKRKPVEEREGVKKTKFTSEALAIKDCCIEYLANVIRASRLIERYSMFQPSWSAGDSTTGFVGQVTLGL